MYYEDNTKSREYHKSIIFWNSYDYNKTQVYHKTWHECIIWIVEISEKKIVGVLLFQIKTYLSSNGNLFMALLFNQNKSNQVFNHGFLSTCFKS